MLPKSSFLSVSYNRTYSWAREGAVLKEYILFQFLEKMQFQFHDQAVRAGIHIVGTCGFDSIPADMGVVFAQENFPGTL